MSTTTSRSNPATRRRGRPDQDTVAFNPVDVHVGSRVRLRRTLLGLSQGNLGKIIGLTFQQVQKYERGANRISASKLFLLSHILDVPVSFFFDDMPSATANSVIADRIPVSAATDTANTPSAAHEPNPLAKRETLELVRAYYRIADPTVRRRLFDLTTSMAKPSDAPIIAPTP